LLKNKLRNFITKEFKENGIDLPDLDELMAKAKVRKLDLGRIDKDMRRTP